MLSQGVWDAEGGAAEAGGVRSRTAQLLRLSRPLSGLRQVRLRVQHEGQRHCG